jgi:hypothetical protein
MLLFRLGHGLRPLWELWERSLGVLAREEENALATGQFFRGERDFSASWFRRGRGCGRGWDGSSTSDKCETVGFMSVDIAFGECGGRGLWGDRDPLARGDV